MTIAFEEVTNNSGISYVGKSWGVAWADFNGDSYPDLWVNNHQDTGNLYLNQGDGTFTDITNSVFPTPESGDTHSAAWADFDRDGDLDLVQVTDGGSKSDFFGVQLYVNEEGILTNEAKNTLLINNPLVRGVLWFDYDNNGLLDIVVSSAPLDSLGTASTIYRQTASGFEYVEIDTVFDAPSVVTTPFGIVSDLTGDGNFELILKDLDTPFIVYDTTSIPFQDITNTLLPTLPSGNDSKIDSDLIAADFNGDLLVDLYLTQKPRDKSDKSNLPDRLFINTEQGFIDQSEEAGFNNLISGVNAVAGDFDNDMDQDIYVVATGSSANRNNVLYDNQGDGTFIAIPNAGGAPGSSLGLGDSVTTVDYDLDGFLDLFVTNGSWPPGNTVEDGPYQLFRNEGNGNNWLQIDLQGVTSNSEGIGAQVFATAGGVTQLREQGGGVHSKSQNHQRIHFGLADNTQVDLLEIRWPSGAVQQLENIAANQLLTITEEDNSNGTPSPINGTNGNDSLLGTADGDIINGLGGNDTIDGAAGSDTIAGGAEQDFLLGRGSNDRLNGGGGDDTLNGNEGSDTLTGGAGNDLLNGGPGTDSLTGGEGGDRFRFFNSTHGVDTITDFTPTEDSLEFIASNFGGGLVPGALAENQLVLGTAAEDSTHRFIYDQSTGNLFFDVDGNGDRDRIWMATLSNQAAVNFDDIALV